MIFINKNAEPNSLTKHRKTPYSSYDNIPFGTKQEIYLSLLKEQGEICSYCMGRICGENINIEHYIPQSESDSEKAMEYNNMLGVCHGNKGKSPKMQTCDTRRGNKPLCVNPLCRISVGKIKYMDDGTIYSDDTEINNDLNSTLNLNYSRLKSNREKALLALNAELKSENVAGDWSSLANRYMILLNSSDKKREYCGILLWYLKKKLKKQ